MDTRSRVFKHVNGWHSVDTTARQSVLVTGASGFIGRRLVCRLVERRHPVTCLVRAGSHIDELRASGVQLVTGDVNDHGSVARALAQTQSETQSQAHAQTGVVFHLAGMVRALHRAELMRVNATGVDVVAEACAGCANPPVLVVVSSLAAVGPCDMAWPRSEHDEPAPVSNYGRSKLTGEHAARRHAHAVPITIVRPPVVFGQGDRGGLEMFRLIARRGVHVVPGRGDQRLSLIHVDDLVEGLLVAAALGERLVAQGSITSQSQGVYFIAGDEQLTHVQLGEGIAAALGIRPPRIIHVPRVAMKLVGMCGDMTARVRRRPVWLSSDKIAEALGGSWTCSSAKAQEHLGWSVAAPLADRLRETAKWYRDAGWL